MPGIIFEVLLIILLLVVNGLFAMSEIAVISARKTRLQQLADEGNTKAAAALELAAHPDRFLSTVQIGITLIGILAGAFGGATLTGEIAPWFAAIPFLAPYSEALAVGLVVLFTTYLSLVIGELVPKRLGLLQPERIASLIAPPMRSLSRIASPVVKVLSVSTNAILRLLGVRPTGEQPVTEEEIKSLVAQGAQAGMIEEAERDIVESVFRLGDRRVDELMTPRTAVIWLDINDPLEVIEREIISSNHSRFPVCNDELDNVLGVVLGKDLLVRKLQNEPLDLQPLLQRPLMVPESLPALRLLERFKQTGMHLALIIDEFGGVEGLVTINDILEAIVGDVPDLNEPEEPMVVQREDGSWLFDGLIPIRDFDEILGVDTFADEGDFLTLGGFVLGQLGRIPTAGDHFNWSEMRFEIVDMDGHRIDKVLVSFPTDGGDQEEDN
jgi:putative hemolysin